MSRLRDVVVLVLIVLPWALLISMWLPDPAMSDGWRKYISNEIQKKYPKNNSVLRGHSFRRPAPWFDLLPTIHVITPTYPRAVQRAELTRLSNTLLHVPNLHWIVVEDSQNKTLLVSRLLRSSMMNYTHLNVKTPHIPQMDSGQRRRVKPRGSVQRNLGLRWLREKFGIKTQQQGVVYFADDDNTYSLELFEEMRWTQKVSVWPVAFVGGQLYESVKINSLGKVYGWDVIYYPQRPFAIDMAGFAVNLQLILSKPDAWFKPNGVNGGYQESSLLEGLVTLSELEPKADNCTKVLVWHTRTQSPALGNRGKKGFTNINMEI